MTMFEYFDRSGDSGMLVAGPGIDVIFRKEADAHDRPDERLITVTPEDLLDPKSIHLAAAGSLALAHHIEVEAA